MTGVLIVRGDSDPERRVPCDSGGRTWSAGAIAKEGRGPLEADRDKEGPFPRGLDGAWPYKTLILDFECPVSKTERIHFWVFFSFLFKSIFCLTVIYF